MKTFLLLISIILVLLFLPPVFRGRREPALAGPHLSVFYPFDPIPYWKEVDVPVFFAFGENDPDVPVEVSIDRLNDSNLVHFKVKTYPNGGHGITDIQTDEVSSKYLHDLVRLINEGR